ncbi:uncharacterized protein LOC129922795 isoform X3 [Biomphalaria glabrata]|uniref:Uncharacterized protein LOC129922795 isoform X3 n=1 Tax=Biomphalaria glabrata TaxID=6526 RepID=A0A9W2YTP8_BIOGL|nr:uncharacterized protein LOC129922795 isoform X3 [Biomphalaria glabrata]
MYSLMPTYVQLILLKMRNIIFILSLLIIQVLRYTPHFRSLSMWLEYFFWLVTGFKFHPKCHAKLSQAIDTMGLIMNRQRESPMATSQQEMMSCSLTNDSF